MKYRWNTESDLTFGELSRDFYYSSLLVDYVMSEHLTNALELLKTKKANPNTVVPELGVAPLHLLAGLENEDFSCKVTLEAILRCGGDPNVRSEEGLTPVHVSAMWGRCKVLEILLVNGGDPELIDYKMFMSAEEYAIKEQQWDAYGVIGTISVMGGEGKVGLQGNSFGGEVTKVRGKRMKNKHLKKLKDKITNSSEDNNSSICSEDSFNYSTVRKNKKINNAMEVNRQPIIINSRKMNRNSQPRDEELHSDQTDCSRNTIKSLKLNEVALDAIKRQRRKTNIYESFGSASDEDCPKKKNTSRKPCEKREKSYLYGDKVSENYDWVRKSGGSLKLNENALETINSQRLSSKIYQTKGLGEDPLEAREKKPPLYEESETCDWVNPRNCEPFDESSLDKIRTQRIKTTTYKSEDQVDTSDQRSPPKLPKRNRRKLHRKTEGSEMYWCGYAEETIRPHEHQQKSRSLTSGISDVNSMDANEGGIVNQRMLCKMSRIFLFMLKKRHIYQKIK